MTGLTRQVTVVVLDHRVRHGGWLAPGPLNCSRPIEFPSGSTNHATVEADVGDAVVGLQPRLVVLRELDAA